MKEHIETLQGYKSALEAGGGTITDQQCREILTGSLRVANEVILYTIDDTGDQPSYMLTLSICAIIQSATLFSHIHIISLPFMLGPRVLVFFSFLKCPFTTMIGGNEHPTSIMYGRR